MPNCIFAPINSPFGASVVNIRISGDKNQIQGCLNALQIKNFNDFLTEGYVKQKNQTKVCKIYKKDGQILDEALCTIFAAPYSFTGEWVVELGLHASPYIMLQVIETLSIAPNTCFAKAGEFSYRAFVNGKIDLIKAESINEIVKSANEKAHGLAFKSYEGQLSKQFLHWRDQLIEISSLLTCYIDFAEDEEINHPFEKKVETMIASLVEDMKQFTTKSIKANGIKDGVRCCIFGPPNVGKSSFLNKICDKNVAIVSSIAGTTRDVIEFTTSIEGLPVIFYDTAGIRTTDDIIELEGIKRAKLSIENSQMQICILDACNLNDFENFKQYLTPSTILIVNKTDLSSANLNIQFDNLHYVSLSSGEGWDEFLHNFTKFIKDHFLNDLSNAFALNARQEGKIKLCIQNLQNLAGLEEIELFSEDIRHCIKTLEEVIGLIDSENILDKMFSTFCIGK